MNRHLLIRTFAALLLVSSSRIELSIANEPPAQTNRIDPAGIDGALVICGGGEVPDEINEQFIQLAGGQDARLIVIPTANLRADEDDVQTMLDPWKEFELASISLLHTRSRDTANDPQFVQPLKEATAVWFCGGQQSRIAEAYLDTAVECELYALLRRGGVIGGTSAGAAIQSRLMIARGFPEAQVATGFDLLPGAVIDQHFLKRGRKPRLLGVLKKHPGHVGVGIDETAAIVVRGRRIRVLGNSTVTVCFGETDREGHQEFVLESGNLADWIALRHAALDRSLPPFPPESANP